MKSPTTPPPSKLKRFWNWLLERLKRPWKWLTSTGGAAVVTMLATALMAWFVVMTYRYNQKMDRPWVLPLDEVPGTVPTAPTGDPGPICDATKAVLCTVIVNSGKSPALNIEVTHRFFLGHPPRLLNRKAFEDHLNKTATDPVGILGPGVTYNMRLGNTFLTAEITRAIADGEKIHSMHCLLYDDTLGRKHSTYYSNCWLPDHRDWGACGDSFAD